MFCIAKIPHDVGTFLARASGETTSHSGDSVMLSWALTFLVIALIAAVLGFVSLAGTAAWAAKICFVVFLVLFVVSALTGRRTPSV